MRLISYEDKTGRGIGVVTDETSFVALGDVAGDLPHTLRGLLEMPDGLARAKTAVAGKRGNRDLAGIRFAPVIPDPHVTWALALNFKKHIEETGLTTSAEFPHLFIRTPASIVGHLQPLQCPPPELGTTFDYEGELGVVIGRSGRFIPVEKALEYVAGYTCFNDGSLREFQRHNRNFGLGKNFEGSGSSGPWLMTSDQFGDPAAHSVVTRLNGIERQNSSLSDMLFSVAQVVHYLSLGYRLRPGDVIAMGTPGALQPPGIAHMKPGDVVDVEISGLGLLRNTIAAGERP
jgi:2-keto-4-pentenoate hydratase/2-oxohepta-3-ene-1,7-dioic acid hydratase in catechol pathway